MRLSRSINKKILITICLKTFIRDISSFSLNSSPGHNSRSCPRHSPIRGPKTPFAGMAGPLSVRSNDRIEENLQSSINDQGTETTDEDQITATTVPSYRQLIAYTATAAMIWLSESVLSLVDTTVIGLRSGSKASTLVELAALGPATTLYDSEVLSTYFLAISTTNQLAPLLAKKKWRELQQRTSELMGLAALLGSAIMMINFIFGKFLLQRMIRGLTDPQIVPLAKEYIWIRSLVTPIVLMGWVSESFCLTAMDTKTPALAVIVAACFNIVGDLALVPFFGIQGAAVATALAAFMFSSMLIRKVQKTTLQWKENEERDAMGNQSAATTEIASPPEIPFLSLPRKQDFLELLRLAGPIFFFSVANLASYSAMKLRAPVFGILSLATHNIMSEIYYFFSCLGESVGQASQTFVPQVAEHEQGKLVRKLFSFSTFIALFNCVGVNIVLRHFSGCFTTESGIAQLMKQFAHYVGIAAVIHPLARLMEGVLLAQRDMKCLVGLYCTTLVTYFGFLFSPLCRNFAGLWQALVFFEGVRAVQFGSRLWQKAKQKKSIGISQ